MKGWNKVPFGDLLIDSKDGEWGEGAPGVGLVAADMIRGTDFAELNSPLKSLPRRYVHERHAVRKRLQVGDIVFEMAGGTAKQSTGRSALITQDFLNRRSEIFVLCASFCRHLRLDHSKYDPKFTYYLLQTLYGAGYMSVFNIQHTGVSRFQYTSFKKHTVLDIPGLATQRKVAAILSAYDDLIANNQRRITLLERMAEDVYREWFVRLRFPGHASMKVEKGIPRGWHFDVGAKFFGHVKGKSYGGDELSDNPLQMPFITLKSFERGGGYRANGLKHYSGRYKPEQVVRQGDIVMAVTDMTQNREVVGRVARVPSIGEKGAVISLDVIKLIPKTISSGFLYSFFRLSGFGDYIKEFANGTNVLHLKPDLVTQQKVRMPPSDLQERFVEIVEPMYHQIDAINLAVAQLVRTRDAILPRLISGKLAVDDLDIQFPPDMTSTQKVT